MKPVWASRSRRVSLIVGLGLLLSIPAGCSGSPGDDNGDARSGVSPDAGMTSNNFEGALQRGTVIRHDRGCLVFKATGEADALLLIPPGAVVEDEIVRFPDGTRVPIGKEVALAGGYSNVQDLTRSTSENPLIDECSFLNLDLLFVAGGAAVNRNEL